jgi:hypothetical protein
MRVRRTLVGTASAATAAILLIGCAGWPTGDRVCAGVGYYAVTVMIRDDIGNPRALGALVELYDGGYYERDSSIYSPLTVFGADERGGRTYDVRVTKPFYNEAWVRGVKAPGGGCVTRGVTVEVPVTLGVAPNAPAVRSINLLPPRALLDRPGTAAGFAFTAYVDASPGTSQALAWSITGDTASVGFDPATGTVHYRCLPKSGFLTITARSLVNPAVFGTAEIAVQGHPGATSDPPCS